jgi:Zn-dependent protease with chaperone function
MWQNVMSTKLIATTRSWYGPRELRRTYFLNPVPAGDREGERMATVFHINDFLHPLDLAARQQLEGIPLLQTAVKKYQSLVTDRRERQWLLSNGVRLGPRQLPTIYRLLPPICDAFGIEQPELYLMRGAANAVALGGNSYTAVIIYNELLEDLAEDEIQAVLAHECGHILASHMLYRQMALALLGVGDKAGIAGPIAGMIANIASVALQKAMINWYRKSELTADRAAAAFMGDPEPMQRALFRILGVPKWMPGDISYAEFAKQAEEFDVVSTASKWDRYLARDLETGSTHPIPTIRVRELITWAQSESYRQLLGIAQQERSSDRRGCGTCGQLMSSDWRFCQRCGNPVLIDGVEPR